MALSSHASFCSLIFIPSVSHHKTTNSENSKLIRNSYYDDRTPQQWSNIINTHEHNTLLSSTHPLQNFKPLSKYPCINIDHDLDIYRELIRKVGEDRPFEGLKIIDAIQRLGIDYIFEEEIDVILQKQYEFLNDHHHQDLHEVALRFRLLRQHGHFIPADVFNKFKDSKGMFDKMLSEDINGLLSLYEASHLGIEGEHILDEASLFTTQHLINTSMKRSLNHYQTTFVANTLKNPTHKTLSKFTAKNLFGVHSSMNEYINLFKELAKSEFNKVQLLHRGEIDQVTKWSRKIGLGKELEFARIQPLKWYIWSLGSLTDPILSQQRVELTKAVSFIYIIDDIFDVYGSLDELILFTQAVSSWENSDIEKLPEYMKICFEALDNMINESCHVVYQKHGWSPLHSLRKTWGRLCHSFLVEAKWFATGHVAKTEEYLKNGVVSSGIPALLLHIFLLLGQGLTSKNALDFVENMPPIVTSTASVVRLWNDLGNAQDKNPKGDDGSYVECYMKEREGSSIEDACENIIEKTSYAWKCLNKECIMNPNPVIPPTFQKACLNFARVVPLRYTYNDDNQQNLEELVKSILYESL